MSARLKRNWQLLNMLKKAKKPLERKAILYVSNDDMILAICEIVDNVLKGTVKLSPKDRLKLIQYKNVMRELTDRKVAKTRKKKLLAQKGGFLPFVLAPALSLAASLLGEVVGKAI